MPASLRPRHQRFHRRKHGLGLDIGDADRICYPIPDTLCNEPRQKRPTAQLLMTMHELEGEPFFADPREVLRQVVSKFTDMGLTICAAFELEFYLIDQENVNGRPQPPRSPISATPAVDPGVPDRRPRRICRLPAGHPSKAQRNKASRPTPSSRKAPLRSSKSTCTTCQTRSRPRTTRYCSSA